MAHDRKPETCSTGFTRTRLVDAVEPLEDSVEILRRYSHAMVLHHQRHFIEGVRHAHMHRGAGLAVLDGVVEQIEQCRRQLAPVTDQSQRVGDGRHMDRDGVLIGRGTYPIYGARNDISYVYAFTFDHSFAFDSTEYQ